METPWESTRHLEANDYQTRLYELCTEADFDDVLMPIALEAIDYYSNGLPYHNIEHMFHVAETALTYCDLRNVHGYQRQVILMAALWHDAGYREPLEEDEISKEHRSAAMVHERIVDRAQLYVDAQGIDPVHAVSYTHFAYDVSQTIISTLAEREPSNVMEQILNEADLSNVSGTSLEVLQNTALLFVEKYLLAGEEVVGDVESFIKLHLEQFTQFCLDSQGFLTTLVQTKFKDISQFAANISSITPANIFKRVFGNDSDDTGDSTP